jgi:hypothetical protein
MVTITFEDESDDGLSRIRWRFYFSDRMMLIVDGYEEAARKTKRHGFKVVRFWLRLNSRNNSMEKSAVPFTQEVAERAKQELFKKINLNLAVDFQ